MVGMDGTGVNSARNGVKEQKSAQINGKHGGAVPLTYPTLHSSGLKSKRSG